MKSERNPKSRSARLTRHFWALVFAWTVIVAGLAVSDAFHTDRSVREMAIAEARTHFNKDQALRFWASSHGGVYVPLSDKVSANPFLSHVPERDIQTPTGKSLTLMNPAYMIRQIMEQYTMTYGVCGHITSLKHFRPETAPDAWETTALLGFEKGEEECLELTEIQGKPYLRLMRPMVAEQDCLKCHGFQGYKVGDVRGGVSVSVPMDPYLDARQEEFIAHGLSFGILWILGFMGIGFATSALNRGIRARDEAEDRLRASQMELRHLSSKLILAQEAERKRVADEIYDDIAQSLIAIKYQMETSKLKMTEQAPPDPDRMFDPFIAAIQEMVDKIRGITARLRPRIVDELGLIPALSSLCRDLRRLYPQLRLEEEMLIQESDIPPSLRIFIYRIAEDSLVNAIRDRGATFARVCLHKRKNEIELTVSDDGARLDTSKTLTQDHPGGGLGMAYIKERLKLSGGVLQIEADPEKGTTLRATWPVEQSIEGEPLPSSPA